MGSYIPPVLQSWGLGGIQAGLAAVYESRVHTISKMTVARAQFAGDTNVTLTDGSYNVRVSGGVVNTPASTPKSSTAFLANSTNTFNVGLSAPNNSWGKPLVVKVKRDEGSSEIIAYSAFNADGTVPGSDGSLAMNALLNPFANKLVVAPALGVPFIAGQLQSPLTYVTAAGVIGTIPTAGGTVPAGASFISPSAFKSETIAPPGGIVIPANYLSNHLVYYSGGVATVINKAAGGTIPAGASFNSVPRYLVNVATGEIYVANDANLIEHKNPDGIVNFLITDNVIVPPGGTIRSTGSQEYFQGANATTQELLAVADNGKLAGEDKVVGMVDFDGLQGGALSSAQAQAADLSAVIQSLTSTLRATNTTKNSILSLIK